MAYTLDANDAHFTTSAGYSSGDDFFAYLRDSFDVLYEEGGRSPKMLSIGLHPRISGRPGTMPSTSTAYAPPG